MKEKVLVTGGSGFIGSHLVKELSDSYDVRAVDRQNPGKPVSSVEYMEANLGDQGLENILKEVNTVFIQSGLTGIGKSIENPAEYHENAIEHYRFLKKVKKSKIENIILGSSIQVYGEGKYRCESCGLKFPGRRTREQMEKGNWEHRCDCGKELQPCLAKEEDPLKPLSPYARSKLALEHFAQDLFSDESLTILRYPFVYGERQGGAAKYFFTTIENNETVQLYEDGNQLRDFTYVKDIAQANIEAMERNLTGVYNLGTGHSLTLKEFVEEIANGLSTQVSIETGQEFRNFDVRHSLPNTAKYQKEFNTEFRAVEKGITNRI